MSGGMENIGLRLTGDTSDLQRALRQSGDDVDRFSREAQRALNDMSGTAVASSRQTANAMRMLPAQVSDIFVSLQGGQKPLTVLLQQGAQIKDMFGGVGAAARGVASYLTALVNPYTMAAGGAALLTYSWLKGAGESHAYTRAILLSGNAAGATAFRMAEMAENVSKVVGTTHEASQTLADLVGSGNVAQASLEKFATVAAKLDRIDVPIKDTVEALNSLARDPLQATIKLNEKFNYLTASVYEHIKALDQQGRKIEAGQAAQDAFIDAMSDRSTRTIDDLGLIEKGWNAITRAIKLASGALLEIGRPATLQDQVDTLSTLIAQRRQRNADLGIKEGQGTRDLLQEQALLQEQIRLLGRGAELSRQRTEATKSLVAWDSAGEKFLSDGVKLQREITQAREQGLIAGKSQAEIDARIAAIRADYAKKGRADPSAAVFKSISERIEALREQNAVEQRLTASQRFGLSILTDLRDGTLKLTEAGKERMGARLAELYGEDQMNTERERAIKLDAENAKIIEKNTEAASKDAQARLKVLESEIQTNDKLREEIALIGLDEAARTRHLQVIEEEAIARLELDLIGKQGIVGQEAVIATIEREILVRKERIKLLGQKGTAEAEAKFSEEFKKSAESINDSLTDALLRGFESGKDFAENFRDTLKNMFRTLVLRPIIQGILAPVSGTLAQAVGSGVGGGSGNLLTSASNGYSLYNGAASVYTVGSQWAAGTMSAANAGGTVFANATGSGLSGLLATNGAYGTAAGAAGGVGAGGAAAGGAGGAGAGGAGALGSAGPAAAVLVFLYALAKVWQESRGEQRGGARFDYMAGVGTSYTDGPDGSRPEGADALVTALIDGTASGLNDAFKSFGSDMTVSALTGAWETSARSRGGVFSGGTLSNGAKFGEDGSGSNYDWSGPLDSKYELWNSEQGSTGMLGSVDLNGDPAKLATDMQQTYVAALQASVGIIPRIVEETYQREVTSGSGYLESGTGWEGGENGSMFTDGTTTRWIREFDDEMKQRARDLGLMPKKILDLIIDVDPESLSSEASAELAGKISTMVANVQGFRTAVEAMPFAYLRDSSFDVAAGLVAAAGGLETFGALLSGFAENFYTPQEKSAQTIRNIAATLSAAGVSVTEAQLTAMAAADDGRLQYRALAEAQDRTTEAGQKNYIALLSVAGAFASVSRELDAAASAADSVRAATDSAYDAFQRATEARLEEAELARSVATERRDTLQELFGTLKNSVAELYGQVESTAAMQAAQGSAFISQALKTVLSSGYLPDNEQLADAIAAATSGIEQGVYVSEIDRQRAQLVLAGELSQLKTAAGTQLTTAQRQLQAAEATVDSLNASLSSWREQIDEQRSTTGAVLSVEEAVQNLADALLVEKGLTAAPAAVAGSGSTSGSGGYSGSVGLDASGGFTTQAGQYVSAEQWADIRAESSFFAGLGDLYMANLGRAPDLSGRDYYDNLYQTLNKDEDPTNDITLEQVLANIQASSEYAGFVASGAENPFADWAYLADKGVAVTNPADLQNIPQLATGTNRVPQDMLAMIHQDEAVLPRQFNPWAGGRLDALGGGAGNAAMANESRLARQAMERLEKSNLEMQALLAGQRAPLMVRVVS